MLAKYYLPVLLLVLSTLQPNEASAEVQSQFADWFAPKVLQISSPILSSDPIQKWCTDLRLAIKKLKWSIEPCSGIPWQQGGTSVLGRPIVFAEFGTAGEANTTLVLAMVHGDEITPLYLAIELANLLKSNPDEFRGKRVVIAPLVNPDSFYKNPRSRVNARGVDVNRNFATQDWQSDALKAWKKKYRSDRRRFPGSQPRSEPETLFQEELIKKVAPQKIVSIHAPLNFLDYDGPTTVALERFSVEYVMECMKLRSRLRAISSGFFPGSLGNYAGQELGIPTLTLELPSANPAKARQYWKQFGSGIHTMIHFAVPDYAAGKPVSPGG
ncbi:MAG TPA: hypothetical protein DCS07_15075 [Bdellovibrionales bacterium]|nr:MAG: hypothetical protein A2Z97_10180 [Bdellovibrionales bacterium GWB1_52_6]OFZ05285.1 MAG: hypothetical protein A2X97_10890 [Bdellovibrionales bacterium GWA1_52_35]OFZ42170.1 MAG: hypothetical protein A2070_07575 [Bdellovibrionales bacterium GWC1_52_8]HAR43933.1 hypothetical protein [Bdellovibrionales bacterium]HCM38577.1 hypothetical protein [Bdellovibrionales bacterium]